MSVDLGQDVNVWSDEWRRLSPESEIRMWDFYGLRNWILKFTPRFGKTIEAGCGLGRYVFYLSELGIDIEGVDFSSEAIENLNVWKKKKNFNVEFKTGNILNLDYPDNSLSGYISLGVIEHFIEGPQKALKEAYRVLKPGGIAIITTPNVSFSILNQRIRRNVKNLIKSLLGKKILSEPFYQYWYKPGKLKRFIEESGFKVIINRGGSLLYSFYEMGNFSNDKINYGSFGYNFSEKFESTMLSLFGSQSLSISVKIADKMHCFLCGELKSGVSSLKVFNVPLCEECSKCKSAEFYKKKSKTKYYGKYIINPDLMNIEKRKCDFCSSDYFTSDIFEDYGFGKNVCNSCLKVPEINILLSNEYVKPVWRKRDEVA